MGAYMAKPIVEKESNSGHTDWISYGVSSMQGWRMQQEDAHTCEPQFDTSRVASLFGVYDGHGGSEVARYCAAHLPTFLRNLSTYSANDPTAALKQLFLDFDASLTTPEARNVLHAMTDKDAARSDDDGVADVASGDEDESDSEICALRAEANQPLESVLERYGGEDALPSTIKDILDHRRATKVGECSTAPVPKRKASPAKSDAAGASTAPPTNGNGPDPSTDSKSTDKKETEQNSDDKIAPTSGSSATVTSAEEASKPEEEKPATIGDEDEDDEDEDDAEFDAENLEEDDDDDDKDDEDSDEDDDDDDDEDDDSDDDEEMDVPFRFGLPSATAEDSEPGVDSGTTACVALLLPMNGVVRLYVANAGDSRAVLCRGGAAVDLSVDHKPEDEDEKLRINAAGGTVTRDGRVNGGLNLSRALGDHSYKQVKDLASTEQMITPLPDIKQMDLDSRGDEFIVLACDGVWNSMTSQEVVDFVRIRLQKDDKSIDTLGADVKKQASKLSQICEEIFDHCLAPNAEGDGTGCDNMTCIIVRFDNLDELAKQSPAQPSLTVGESRKRIATTVSVSGEDGCGDAVTDKCSNGKAAVVATSPKRAKSEKSPISSSTIAVANGTAV